jgi:hypothetical protein
MKIGKALAALAAVFCTACQYSPTMLDRTVAYNRAVADSTNQVLLLNIVRASQRLPTYYSRLEGDAASMALAPNAGLSLPLANQRSFESDLNSASTGAFTGGATKAITSLASIAGSFGLQASESNLLTLQTLDDQKYQNGMMTPVPIKNIQAFQDEGYPRDLLFMMFFSSIQVSRDLIDPIDKAVIARCTQVTQEQQPAAESKGVSFARQICAYIQSDPYGELFPSGGRSHPDYSAFSLKTCEDTGGADTDDPPNVMVHFHNDPAREGRMGSAGDPHPLVCFQILLDDLLVLGLKVGSAQDSPAELVDVVPAAVARDPKFRAQMIQQNLFVRETADGKSAVCRKMEQSNGFTVTFADPSKRGGQASSKVPMPLDALLTSLGVRANSVSPTRKVKAPSDPATACQQKNPGAPETADEAKLGSNGDAESSAPRPVKLTSDKVAFSTRSFEAMIYYLGETLRYEESEASNPSLFPRVLGRNPMVAGNTYYETMFYGSSGLNNEDAAVTVRDDAGTSFAIPKPCVTAHSHLSSERKVNCTSEYPDNESLQILNFVNQVWGLQKESVAAPSSPLVVVSPQ